MSVLKWRTQLVTLYWMHLAQHTTCLWLPAHCCLVLQLLQWVMWSGPRGNRRKRNFTSCLMTRFTVTVLKAKSLHTVCTVCYTQFMSPAPARQNFHVALHQLMWIQLSLSSLHCLHHMTKRFCHVWLGNELGISLHSAATVMPACLCLPCLISYKGPCHIYTVTLWIWPPHVSAV